MKIAYAALLLTNPVYGQAPVLVILARAPADAQLGEPLTVDVEIRNASGKEQVLQIDGCNYLWNWKTDSADVRASQQNVACKKNPIEFIKLEADQALTRTLVVNVSLSGTRRARENLTFRVGCQPRLGSNLLAEAPAYLWSNPVRVRVK